MAKSTRKPKTPVFSIPVVLAAYDALTGRGVDSKMTFAAAHQYITDVMGPRDRNKLYARIREVQLQWPDMTHSEVGECVRTEGYTYGRHRKGL